MSLPAKTYARDLVASVKPIWSNITSCKVDPRKEVLRSLTVNEAGTELQPGIAGVYLETCARNGDRSAYELMVDLGMSPDFPRPKKQGGRAQAGMRAFLVHFLVAKLMGKSEELKVGANDATSPGKSATDMIREALEEAGLACIDARKAASEAPNSRAMEKALRRLWRDPKYLELFDPVWTKCYEDGTSER